MNEFIASEIKGRSLFKSILDQLGIQQQHPSKDLYDTIDYYYTNKKGEEVGVEIKTRDQKYLSYTTHFLELAKFTSIISRLDKQDFKKALYVNFFGEDIAYIYSLDSVRKGIQQGKIKLSSITCNKTTAANNGKVPKDIIEIPLVFGIRLEKKEDKWIIIQTPKKL